jgi:hypothetical protein
MKRSLLLAGLLMSILTVSAQVVSPEVWSQGKIGEAKLTIKYCAPSVRGRDVFGESGPVMHDRTAPIWRAGANAATTFHTNKNLKIEGLTVPKGNYSLFVNLKDPENWELILNKQTGQWGLTYDASQDLGRVKMHMSQPPSPVEVLKWTITPTGDNSGTIQLAWAKHAATVNLTVNE